MSDPTPPRPSIATLLRQASPRPADDASAADAHAPDADAVQADAPAAGPPHDAEPPRAPADAAATAGHARADIDDPGSQAGQVDAPATSADAAPPPGPAPRVADEPAAADAPGDARPQLAAEPAAPHTAPSFMRVAAAPRPVLRAARWQWAALAGLSALLVVQILVADRQRLAADARWRPWVAAVCQVLRCELPAWREPAAFTMLSREVRPLPGRAGALQVQATFRNDARWAQAWPLLQLSLADADGRTVGTRLFRPDEYLGRQRADAPTLSPGQSAQIAFQVREPAAGTAAFSFEFR